MAIPLAAKAAAVLITDNFRTSLVYHYARVKGQIINIFENMKGRQFRLCRP